MPRVRGRRARAQATGGRRDTPEIHRPSLHSPSHVRMANVHGELPYLLGGREGTCLPPHLIASHLTSSHLTSAHLTSSRTISHHLRVVRCARGVLELLRGRGRRRGQRRVRRQKQRLSRSPALRSARRGREAAPAAVYGRGRGWPWRRVRHRTHRRCRRVGRWTNGWPSFVARQ